jgi:hypothetical protein
MGDVRLGDAMRQGLIRLDGLPSVARAFPTWLALSSFAAVPRPRRDGAGRAAT